MIPEYSGNKILFKNRIITLYNSHRVLHWSEETKKIIPKSFWLFPEKLITLKVILLTDIDSFVRIVERRNDIIIHFQCGQTQKSVNFSKDTVITLLYAGCDRVIFLTIKENNLRIWSLAHFSELEVLTDFRFRGEIFPERFQIVGNENNVLVLDILENQLVAYNASSGVWDYITHQWGLTHSTKALKIINNGPYFFIILIHEHQQRLYASSSFVNKDTVNNDCYTPALLYEIPIGDSIEDIVFTAQYILLLMINIQGIAYLRYQARENLRGEFINFPVDLNPSEKITKITADNGIFIVLIESDQGLIRLLRIVATHFKARALGGDDKKLFAINSLLPKFYSPAEVKEWTTQLMRLKQIKDSHTITLLLPLDCSGLLSAGDFLMQELLAAEPELRSYQWQIRIEPEKEAMVLYGKECIASPTLSTKRALSVTPGKKILREIISVHWQIFKEFVEYIKTLNQHETIVQWCILSESYTLYKIDRENLFILSLLEKFITRCTKKTSILQRFSLDSAQCFLFDESHNFLQLTQHMKNKDSFLSMINILFRDCTQGKIQSAAKTSFLELKASELNTTIAQLQQRLSYDADMSQPPLQFLPHSKSFYTRHVQLLPARFTEVPVPEFCNREFFYAVLLKTTCTHSGYKSSCYATPDFSKIIDKKFIEFKLIINPILHSRFLKTLQTVYSGLPFQFEDAIYETVERLGLFSENSPFIVMQQFINNMQNELSRLAGAEASILGSEFENITDPRVFPLPIFRRKFDGQLLAFVFHGTAEKNIENIATEGFRFGISEFRQRGALYSEGAYFAIEACKALKYSIPTPLVGERRLLLCAILLGNAPLFVQNSQIRSYSSHRTATIAIPSYTFISSQRQQSHFEFIIKNENAIYPVGIFSLMPESSGSLTSFKKLSLKSYTPPECSVM